MDDTSQPLPGPPPTDPVTGLPDVDPDFKAKHKARLMAFLTGETTDEPEMNAVDPGQWAPLSALIPGLIVGSAGGAVPFESTGWIHSMPYYFRYRHGTAALRLGAPGCTDSDLFFKPLYSTSIEYGDQPHGGDLDAEEFCDLMLAMVPALERAPFMWEFPATDAGEATVAHARGHTPAEAFAVYHDFSGYPEVLDDQAREQGYRVSRGDMEAYITARHVQPTPLNADDRVFADPEPVFAVRASSLAAARGSLATADPAP